MARFNSHAQIIFGQHWVHIVNIYTSSSRIRTCADIFIFNGAAKTLERLNGAVPIIVS